MNDRKGVLVVMYDLPMTTRRNQREYRQFRKLMILNGYRMLQESVYVKLLRNMDSAAAQKEFIYSTLPKGGQVNMLTMTLAQFKQMESNQGGSFDLSLFSDDVLWF